MINIRYGNRYPENFQENGNYLFQEIGIRNVFTLLKLKNIS